MHGQSANGYESKLQHGARWKKVGPGAGNTVCIGASTSLHPGSSPDTKTCPKQIANNCLAYALVRASSSAWNSSRSHSPRHRPAVCKQAGYLRARACGSILAQPTEANAKAFGKRPRSMVNREHFGYTPANNTNFTLTCFATCKSPASPD